MCRRWRGAAPSGIFAGGWTRDVSLHFQVDPRAPAAVFISGCARIRRRALNAPGWNMELEHGAAVRSVADA
jgi:hypothetical protein